MFRSCQIIIMEICCSLLKLLHIHDLVRFLNKVLWQHVVLCGNLLWRVQLAGCASYAA